MLYSVAVYKSKDRGSVMHSMGRTPLQLSGTTTLPHPHMHRMSAAFELLAGYLSGLQAVAKATKLAKIALLLE